MTAGLTEPGSAPADGRGSRTHRILRSPIVVGAAVLPLIVKVVISVLIERASSRSPLTGRAARSPPAVSDPNGW
jgi:hypothetical protein